MGEGGGGVEGARERRRWGGGLGVGESVQCHIICGMPHRGGSLRPFEKWGVSPSAMAEGCVPSRLSEYAR